MAADDRRRTLLAYAAAGVVLLVLAARALGGSGGPDQPTVAIDGQGAPARAGERDGTRIWVHVAGAVRRPGLYRVAPDSRAGAAVEAAGGTSRRADLRAINLAATVRDGQQVVVPARGEQPTTPAPAAGSVGPAGDPPAGTKLSLASATAEQLDTLDGIGPTLAQRILEWRDAHGGFQSVEQLREVDGIGDKRFESLRSAVQP